MMGIDLEISSNHLETFGATTSCIFPTTDFRKGHIMNSKLWNFSLV
jgi:hypothetical protein